MAAKNKFLNAMKMPSIDDMFSSEADRQRESGDLVTEVPLSELHPFVGHPFEVRDDEDMQKLVDSIRENGVLTNLTVRRRTEGGYEIISGHRRFHAAQRAGLDRVKVQVRDIDDDQAIIDMVDSNIQRAYQPDGEGKGVCDEAGSYQPPGSTTRFNFPTTCREVGSSRRSRAENRRKRQTGATFCSIEQPRPRPAKESR